MSAWSSFASSFHEASVHLLREIPDLIRGLHVHPVVKRGVKIIRTRKLMTLGKRASRRRNSLWKGRGREDCFLSGDSTLS